MLSYLADYPGRLVLVIDDLHELESAGAADAPDSAADGASLARARGTRRRGAIFDSACISSGWLASWRRSRAADLRFTEAETREVLAASGVVLSDQAVATLHKRTEGWAAGIRLADDLTRGASRSGALRRRVLREQPHGRRLPDQRAAGASAVRTFNSCFSARRCSTG